MSAVPLEQQYVLYAAATHSSLLDLLTHWQPWLPDLEWPDIAAHIPPLAEAITALVAGGQIELFLGENGGEVGLVSPPDVPEVVMDPDSWWSPIDGTTPETALLLTPGTGPVPLPRQRPDDTIVSEDGHRQAGAGQHTGGGRAGKGDGPGLPGSPGPS